MFFAQASFHLPQRSIDPTSRNHRNQNGYGEDKTVAGHDNVVNIVIYRGCPPTAQHLWCKAMRLQ